ncbi:MAG: class D beta-lactamase [Verrucomicrobiota bacterium]
MHRVSILFAIFINTQFVLSLCPNGAYAAEEQTRWARFFQQFEARGTIAIYDERLQSKRLMTFNGARAQKRFTPASTFKIPHSLFALDSGVIQDEFETISWDGKKRFHPAWNRDQNLRSSMRHSVVWVYEKFAKEIGEQNEQQYLKKIRYGNQDPSGKWPFWLKGGNLKISALEQIAFLKKLYRNELPFRIRDQRLVKDVMLIEAGRNWILRGKTGWDGSVGWWVGWVEHPTGSVFFALNIDTPNGAEDAPKREGIARAVLVSIDALEPSSDQDNN